MNDDLHDIDKLFRDGINEHREPLPPAVWEGVSHSLDQQQAAHFKRKYYRLRKWSLLLLLLGATGGGYFLIEKLKNGGVKQEAEYHNFRATKETRRPAVNEVPKSENPRTDNLTKGKDKDELNELPPVAKPTMNEVVKANDKTESGDKTGNQLKLTPNSLVGKEDRPDMRVRSTATTVIREKRKTNKNLSVGIRNFSNQQEKEATLLAKSRGVEGQPNSVKQLNHPDSRERFHATIIPTRDFSRLEPKSLAMAERKSIVAVQTPDNKKNRAASSHSLSLNVFAAPNFSFDHMEDDDHLSGPGRNRRDFRKEEAGGTSFSAGVLLTYPLNNKLFLESGLTYTFSSTNIDSKKVYAKADGNGRTRYELQCSSGYSYITLKGVNQPAVGDSATLSSGKTSLSYLSVPLAAVYSINKGKFSLCPSLGVGVNFLLNGKTDAAVKSATGTETSTNAISGLKSAYLDGRLGIGAEYRLNNKLSIRLRPTARIALTSINQETPVRSYQNFLSVEAGLRIKL